MAGQGPIAARDREGNQDEPAASASACHCEIMSSGLCLQNQGATHWTKHSANKYRPRTMRYFGSSPGLVMQPSGESHQLPPLLPARRKHNVNDKSA